MAARTEQPQADSDTRRAPRTRSISVLGPLKIDGERQRGRRLRSLTVQLLLYLTLHPEGATVEQLADELLPDTDPEKSRGRLWQSASEARRILDDGFKRNDDGRYELDRKEVHVDLDDLDRLANDAKNGAEPGDPARLEQALDLFRGEPLADIEWIWAEGHVRHLRGAYVDLLAKVAKHRIEDGNPRGALVLAERGLGVDRLNEDLWCLAMQADSAIGLRDSVSQRYEHLRDLLERELGLEPAVETRRVLHDLLGQN